jgi:hypothetical protein
MPVAAICVALQDAIEKKSKNVFCSIARPFHADIRTRLGNSWEPCEDLGGPAENEDAKNRRACGWKY